MNNDFFSSYKEHWLLAYDMHSNAQRSKLCRELQKTALSRQKSFFEFRADERQMHEIALFACDCIDEESDKLLIVCTTKTLKTHRLGGNKLINLNGLLVIK
ncbi:MAG: CRISPR-associated endonuclease Cas2 [Alcaligenaceae bacterium]|nr:CRISPR-associated endonuclease Cas2 [Alcaligenaceae bacterium]